MVAVRAEHWMQATWNRQEFILPPLNHQMIAEDEHRKGGHLGIAATVANIRCRFLITGYYFPKISENHCHKYIICKWKFQRLSGQVMARLPLEQLQPSIRVRIDFFGPFTIKGEVQMRIHRKCNGLTFVCFSSRAVHVDVSKDYSTDSFFQVMWQFSRRSTPIILLWHPARVCTQRVKGRCQQARPAQTPGIRRKAYNVRSNGILLHAVLHG